MNAKIPFEVVNTTLETNEDIHLPIESAVIDTPAAELEALIGSVEASSSDLLDDQAQAPAQASVETKPAKKIRAKKLRDALNVSDFDSAISALASMPESLIAEAVAAVEVPETLEEDTFVEAVAAVAAVEVVAPVANVEVVAPVATIPPVKVLKSLGAESVSDIETSPFEEFNLLPAIVAAIEAAGYTSPTPIQAETIPHILAGKDIIGRAETGSGKTAAFACPLLSMIDVDNKAPQVLVLAPTRELAIQVTKSFEKYGAELPGFRAVTIYGGQGYEIQNSALRRGVQIVVGTPGRVMDHLRQGTLNLSTLKTIVLDEADEMLRMGFIDDVEWILQQIPAARQTLLFSATMPGPIQKIAQNHLRKPVNISIQSDSAAAESILQSCILVQPRTKIDLLAQILESEQTDGVIVFVKTRDTTVTIADQLSQRGFSAAPLNGEIPQNQRERTVAHLKSGRLNVLVATDVAARGLDVQRISHVVNYDFPHDTEAYIHRIGRTGRAGREGTAILFVEPKEKGKLKRLQRETNHDIKVYREKSIDEINQIRIDRFKDRITDVLANSKSLDLFAKIVNEYQQETETPLERVAMALAAMAQGEAPLLLKQVVQARSNFKNETEQKGKRYQGEMTTYRVEVGRNQGVGPGNIVGAITNETGLEYASIGRIKLFDDFSIVDLPAGLAPKMLAQLSALTVSGHELRISEDRRSNRTSPGRFSERGERGSKGGRSDRGARPERRDRGPRTEGAEQRTERAQRSVRTERVWESGPSSKSPASRGPASKGPESKGPKKSPAREFGSAESRPSRGKFESKSKPGDKTAKGPLSREGKTGKPKRKFVRIRDSK